MSSTDFPFKQTLLALDQLLNTFVYAKLEGTGYSDETLSARMWRLRHSRNWGIARKIVDTIFLALFNEWDHCKNSYDSETKRAHLPPEYWRL